MVGPHDPPRGILDLTRGLQSFRLERLAPAPALAQWIENYWEVAWDLPPGVVHRQTNLSHAAFNVAVEPQAWLYGVPGPTFVRHIEGKGRVFGVKFHPGAFFAWLPMPLKPFFDRRVPAAEALGASWELWARDIERETDLGRRASLTDAFLAARQPGPPGEGRRCVRTLIADRTLIRVKEACRQLGHTSRSLQRLFEREVGVAPKEVLRRYRLMEAAERLASEPGLPGAELAAGLGYADQAHFIRDFKAVTGVSPEAYRRRQEESVPPAKAPPGPSP